MFLALLKWISHFTLNAVFLKYKRWIVRPVLAHASKPEIEHTISHVLRVRTLLIALSHIVVLMWRPPELLVVVEGLAEGFACPSTIILSKTLKRNFFQKNYSNAAFESLLAEQQFRPRVFCSPTIQAKCAAWEINDTFSLVAARLPCRGFYI